MSDVFIQLEINRIATALESRPEAPAAGAYCTFRNLGNATVFYRRAIDRPRRADRIGIPLLPLEGGEVRTAPTAATVTSGGATADFSSAWAGVVGRYWFWTEPGQSSTVIFNWHVNP